MAYIKMISRGEATGLLAKLYDEAVRRAGKIFNINRIQSVRPHALRACTQLYMELMLSDRSNLPRRQREMIGVVVSWANACEY